MSLPIENLTPTQIVAELDRFIVGQMAAKRAVAVALRNRYRRQQLPHSDRDEIVPKNILMIGPTGVGKTEIARRLAQLARAPFLKVEATKFTEVGYVGRDVESMIRDLVASSVRLVERERMEAVRPEAERRAFEKLANMLMEARPSQARSRKLSSVSNPIVRQAIETFGLPLDDGYPDGEQETDSKQRSAAAAKRRLIKEIVAGNHDSKLVTVEVEEQQNPFFQVFTQQGLEEMGLENHPLSGMMGRRSSRRTVTVAEAKTILLEEESRHLMDRSSVQSEAVVRAEQTGIIFLDEIDKVASKSGGSGPDVSREGVQRDLLPIIEGSTVVSKFGPVKTDHILFIAAGAFHTAKPSDLIPELQGRLPIRVELEALRTEDFRRILSEPKNALVKQYAMLLETEGVQVSFSDDALETIAELAVEVNTKTENIGARRLHTLLEKLLEDLLFDAPESSAKEVAFDATSVRQKLSGLVQDVDLSRYIL